MKTRIALAGLLSGLLLLLGVGAVEAKPLAVPLPTLTVFEADAFRNLLVNGDMLFLIRYQAPAPATDYGATSWRATNDTTSTGTPLYMQTAKCVLATNFKDACWTSLNEGIVLMTLYKGAYGSTLGAPPIQLPRFGHGLAAIYVPAGSGLTWGSTTYQTCIEGSATVFAAPVPFSCKTILWNASTGISNFPTPTPVPTPGVTSSTEAVLATVLPQMLSNLEQAMGQPKNSYVQAGKISPTGYDPFINEAFSAMAVVCGSCFVAGVSAGFSPISLTPVASKPLASNMMATAQASNFYQNVAAISQDTFGFSPTWGGSVGVIAFAVFFVLLINYVTGVQVFGLLGGFVVMLIGMASGFMPVQVVWVILAVILIVGSSWLFRRAPG